MEDKSQTGLTLKKKIKVSLEFLEELTYILQNGLFFCGCIIWPVQVPLLISHLCGTIGNILKIKAAYICVPTFKMFILYIYIPWFINQDNTN